MILSLNSQSHVDFESYKLKSKDSKPLDWNLRLLTGSEGVFGIEARVGENGKPVNVSLGAKVYDVDELQYLLLESGLEVSMINNMLDEANLLSTQIAKSLNMNLAGIDLIIDKNLKPRVLELNGKKSGGFISLAKLKKESEQLLPFWKFLNSLSKLTAFKPKSITETNSRIKQKEIYNDINNISPKDLSNQIDSLIKIFGSESNHIQKRFSKRIDTSKKEFFLNFIKNKLESNSGPHQSNTLS